MFRQMLSKLRKAPPFPPVAPDTPFTVIGDLHGRADLLDSVLKQQTYPTIVCVGDYVDRGEQSAEVLRTLFSRPEVICLSGNHEEMMLNFIDAPDKFGSRWLRFGGLQTLSSFGVSGVTEGSDELKLTSARDQLVEAMGQALLDWLLTLPTYWQSGNVAVVHAGADPDIAIEDQTARTFHWGHPEFAKTQRTDGVWIVHGHTIVDEPTARDGRISVDTGAYATGCLTMAHVEPSKVRFQSVT